MSLLLNSTTAKREWDFDPTTIPGCSIWFDATDISTFVFAGSIVKAWKNKGSLDMFAVEDTVGSNGGVMQAFDIGGANGFLSIPSGTQMSFTCAHASATARSWFVVARCNTQIASGSSWGIVNQTAGSGQEALSWSRNGNTTYTVSVAPSGNATNQATTTTAPNFCTTFNVFAIVHSATAANNVITVNGTSYTLSTSGVASGYNTGTLRYTISTANQNINTSVGELIRYDRDLSRSERIAIEGYLMWKWGIRSQTDFGVTPTSIPGCIAWYDSDVDFSDDTSKATSFTFSAGSSILVDVWKDKSGNGRNATFLNSGSSTTRPTLTANQLNGKPTVIFNGFNTLNTTLAIPSSQATSVFIVAASTALGSFRAAISLNANPGTRGSLLSIYQSSSNLWWFSGGNVSTDGNTTTISIVSGRYDILSCFWSTSLRTQMFINGHTIPSSQLSPSSLTANSTMLIGSTTTNVTASTSPTELWAGGIAEIIVYNRIVSLSEQNQIERYLSLKWSRPLVNACPIGHPNKWVPVTQRRFNPTDIGDCRAWYDASDPSTITFSGSNVSQWNDKSGNGLNMTPRSTFGTATISTGFQNGLNVLNFSDNTIYAAPAGSAVYPLDAYIVVAIKTLARSDVFSITAPASTDNFNSLTFGEHTARRWHNGSTNFNRTPLTVSSTDETSTDFLIMNWSLANSNYVIRRNGTQLSFTSSYTFTLTANSVFQIGYRQFGSPPDIALNAYIAEIVVYSRQLGDGDRQRLEGYLADKWSLRTSLPTTHPVYYPIPTSSTEFQPNLITGLALWLDGADSSSNSMTLSGSTLTQWRDKSGTISTPGTAFNSPTLVTNALNGRTAVQFNSASSQYIDFGDANDMFNNQFCLFAVCNFASTTGNGSIIAKSIQATGAGRYALIRENGVIVPVLERSGGVFNGSGWASTSTQVRVFTMQWDRTNLILYHNGTAVSTTAFAEAAGTVFNNSYKLLVGGYLNASATAPVSTFYFNGVIMEIIMYLAPLTTVQRQRVENYLADKWGTHWSSQVTAPVPFYSPQVSDTINFNPSTSISGCRLWVDASDINSVNSGSVTTGGTVTSLADKSGTGVTITTVGTPSWDYSLNKLPGITLTSGRFTGSFTSAIPTFAHTCFIVTMLNSDPTAGYPCFGIANSATSSTRWIRCLDWATSIRAVGFFGTTVPVALVTPPTNGTPFLWVSAFNGVNPLYVSLNSGNSFNSSSTIAISPGANATHFAIGTEPFSGTNVSTWPGVVSEIILYDRVLTTVDRIRVEKYLARKWNLTQRILSTNRFSTPGAIPNSPRLFPTTFTDIALWLDAADPDADGIMPASGTSVRHWLDKSGNNKHCVQTTQSQRPTFTFVNGYPAIQFNANNSQVLVGSSLLTSLNYGIFIVHEHTGGTGSLSTATVSFFCRKVTTANAENYVQINPFAWLINNLSCMFIYYNANSDASTSKLLLTSFLSGRRLNVISDNSAAPAAGQSTFFIDGLVRASTSTSSNGTANVATDAEGYRLGASNQGGTMAGYLTGNIYEVIVMLHQPTTFERQVIEGYLAWKWGLDPNLPSTHPYKQINP